MQDEAKEAIRRANAAHRRLDELHDDMKEISGKIDSIERNTRIRPQHIIWAITACAVIGSLLVFIFFTRTEGTKLEEQVSTLKATQAQTVSKVDQMDERTRVINLNVTKIGEALRIKNMIEREK